MPKIVLQSCDSDQPFRNFTRTVASPVDLTLSFDIDAVRESDLGLFHPSNRASLWGLPDTSAREARLAAGDLVLFHRKRTVFSFGLVGGRCRSAELSRRLWDLDEYGRHTYSRIFSVVRPGESSLPLSRLGELTGERALTRPSSGTFAMDRDWPSELCTQIVGHLADQTGRVLTASVARMSIFLSYAHEDSDLVDQLEMSLRKSGADVYRDTNEELLGDSVVKVISEGIHGADFFVAVLSEASVRSKWCAEELEQATTRGIDEERVFVLPVLVGETDPPRSVAHRYWIRLDASTTDRTAEMIVRDARQHLARRLKTDRCRSESPMV